MKKSILFILVAAFIFSCEKKMNESSAELADSMLTDEQTIAELATIPTVDLYSDGKTKLIKEADYRFEVKNMKESTSAIETAVKKYPAYISASSLKLENPILENKMTIRIQSEYFNELLQEIDKQAIFVNVRNVATDDVSKEFVDLESRLNTKREVEARYMTILRNKAGSIDELLKAEKEIGALHEEIEATVSRINYLKDQVRYSSINLEFYQAITETITKNEHPVAGKFAEAFAAGFNGVVSFGIVIVYIWPLLFIAAGVVLFLMYRKRRIVKC
jgi:hypothetical protein